MTGRPSVLFVRAREGMPRMRLVRDDIATRVRTLTTGLGVGLHRQ